MTQHVDHDTEAVDRAPHRMASPPAHRGALAGPDGEQSSVVRLSSVLPWRAGGQSSDGEILRSWIIAIVNMPMRIVVCQCKECKKIM